MMWQLNEKGKKTIVAFLAKHHRYYSLYVPREVTNQAAAEVEKSFRETGKAVFVIAAEESASGKEERIELSKEQYINSSDGLFFVNYDGICALRDFIAHKHKDHDRMLSKVILGNCCKVAETSRNLGKVPAIVELPKWFTVSGKEEILELSEDCFCPVSLEAQVVPANEQSIHP